MKIEEEYIKALKEWLGEDNIRYFKHLKGLKGEVFPVLRLNYNKKGIPAHPVHFMEGMQIRNFLRNKFKELEKMGSNLLDEYTIQLMDNVIKN